MPVAVQLRIPKSSARNAENTWAKMITRVDPTGIAGFAFEGRIVRPGAVLDVDELDGGILLIECAGVDPSYVPASQRARYPEFLYILWQFERGMWRELARATDSSWGWVVVLRPVAAAALERFSGSPGELHDLEGTKLRLGAAVEKELHSLSRGDQERVLGFLHDQLASRMAGM